MSLKGKTAVVTGSNSGIGLGVARELAKAGADIVLNSFTDRPEDHDLAASMAAEFGVSVRYIQADMSKGDDCRALIEKAGVCDILVNNAGIQYVSPIDEFPVEKWDAIIAINMNSAFHTTAAALPMMRQAGWGRVVNITSQSVKAPIPQLGLSNSARAGLTGFVAGTSRQVAPYGVTINNMLPGLHDTDRALSLDTGVSTAEGISIADARAKREATIPAQRYGTTTEFGAMCAFLCSDKAGFIVGQNIMLDGGAANMTM